MEHFFQLLVDQTTRTNDLLEKQEKRMLVQQMTLQKLEEHLKSIDLRLEHIEEVQLQMAEILERDLLSYLDQPLLLKQDVIDRLQVVDSTYRNYVEQGKLKPMKLGKIEYYFARDFVKTMLASKYRKK